MSLKEKIKNEAFSVDSKMEIRAITKALRKIGKANNKGQYDIAITMLRVFFRVVSLYESFLGDVGLEQKWDTFVKSMDTSYESTFANMKHYVDLVEKEVVPTFGE